MVLIKAIILIGCLIGGHHRVDGNSRGQYGHGSHQHMAKHRHYVPTPDAKEPVRSVLDEKQLLHDQEHLKEDLKEVYTDDQIFKMTTDEIEFHYFKMHDYDDNNLLDGVEMMAAIAHIAPHDDDLDLAKLGEGHVLSDEQQKRLAVARTRQMEQFSHYTNMIDRMMADSDKDKDGFINYQEYKNNRRPNGV